jgi:hypothetical protein
MRALPPALVLLAFLGASACKAGGGGAYDGGAIEGGVFDVSLSLPDGCPPPSGNEKGVGTPCTMGGGECKGNLRCACDRTLGVTLVGVPCICTLFQLAEANSQDPCGAPLPANFCGSNATCCSYLNAAAYCVPSICLEGNACPEFTTQ